MLTDYWMLWGPFKSVACTAVFFSIPIPIPIAWGNTILSVSTFFGMKFPKYSHQHMIIWFVWFVVSISITRIWADTIWNVHLTCWQGLDSFDGGVIHGFSVVCRKRLAGESNIFILLTNYFSCMYDYLTPMALVVLSLMRGVLYVTMSAAKGCLMSVHQINNWSHPRLCLHCFGLKKCSILTL